MLTYQRWKIRASSSFANRSVLSTINATEVVKLSNSLDLSVSHLDAGSASLRPAAAALAAALTASAASASSAAPTAAPATAAATATTSVRRRGGHGGPGRR